MAGILLVREIMIRAVKTVGVNVNVRKAVQKMNKFDIGSIVVMDGGRPVGILTERDVLRLVEQSIDPSRRQGRCAVQFWIGLSSRPLNTPDHRTRAHRPNPMESGKSGRFHHDP